MDGTLGGEALRAFEAELAHDPGLRIDLEAERTLRATLQRSLELRFRDLVQQVSGQQERDASDGGTSEPPVIGVDRGRWKWWAAAASVAVLLGVGGLIMRFSGNADRMALAQVEGYTWQVRGDGSADAFNIAMTRARELVLEGKPGDAVAFLANLEATGCPEAERRWLLGAARLLSGDRTSAKLDLEFAGQAGCAVSPKAKALLEEL
ncbi:MAG: hypothetical protein H6591_05835 [Flavobacteriales bacterium]|nr:hypothetical protein [Flavobacteriales bacterium]